MKLHALSTSAFVVLVAGCGSKAPATATPTNSGGSSAKEGESCGNGVLGAPNIQCADGLVCDYGAGTAPTAPACKKK